MAAGRDDLSPENINKTAQFLAGRWCVNGCLNAAELEKTRAFIYSKPDFAEVKSVAVDEIVDQSFVAKAVEKLGSFEGTTLDAR